MSPSFWQILIVVVLAVLLFGGRGKISSLMGDVAKGIKSFRKGLAEDEVETPSEPKSVGSQQTPKAEQSTSKEPAENS